MYPYMQQGTKKAASLDSRQPPLSARFFGRACTTHFIRIHTRTYTRVGRDSSMNNIWLVFICSLVHSSTTEAHRWQRPVPDSLACCTSIHFQSESKINMRGTSRISSGFSRYSGRLIRRLQGVLLLDSDTSQLQPASTTTIHC